MAPHFVADRDAQADGGLTRRACRRASLGLRAGRRLRAREPLCEVAVRGIERLPRAGAEVEEREEHDASERETLRTPTAPPPTSPSVVQQPSRPPPCIRKTRSPEGNSHYSRLNGLEQNANILVYGNSAGSTSPISPGFASTHIAVPRCVAHTVDRPLLRASDLVTDRMTTLRSGRRERKISGISCRDVRCPDSPNLTSHARENRGRAIFRSSGPRRLASICLSSFLPRAASGPTLRDVRGRAGGSV